MNYRIITVKNYFGKARPAQVLLEITMPDSDTIDLNVTFTTNGKTYTEVNGCDNLLAAQAWVEDFSERSARAFMDRAHASMKLAK